MRYVFTLLTVFLSGVLCARLSPAMIADAVALATVEQEAKDIFYYELADVPEFTKAVEEANATFPLKAYGPYRPVLKGLPAGTQFEFYQCNLAGILNPTLCGCGYIDHKGDPWINNQGAFMPLSNHYQFVGSTFPGEPVFAFALINNQKCIATYVVPEPLQSSDDTGRKVSLEVHAINSPIFLIRGENFQIFEQFTCTVHSSEDVVVERLVAGADGNFLFIVGIDPSLKASDSDRIEISSASQEAPIVLHYDLEPLKYLNLPEAAEQSVAQSTL